MNGEIIKVVKQQLDELVIPRSAVTHWRIFSFNELTGDILHMVEQPNIIPYQGADIIAQLLAGNDEYAPRAMFFEFENTAGAPTIPSPTRDEDISYYLSDLSLEPTKDYLRIPIVVSPSITASGGDYTGNQVTFFGVTSGLLGIHGKTFDSAVDSKVYGIALAATPVPDQYTQDWLFSRSYTGFDPIPKVDGYQIGGQYLIRLV